MEEKTTTTPSLQWEANEGGNVSGEDTASEASGSSGDTLERTMGLASGTAMVVGLIVGSGIFSTPALVWSLAGSPGMAMVMWLLGGLLTFFGALSYTELGTMLPTSGGEQAYLSRAFRRPRELLAFVFSWSLIVCIYPGASAANAVVFGEYLLFAAFGPRSELATAADVPTAVLENYDWIGRGIGLACITSLTVLNALSTRWTLRLLTLVTAIKLVVLTVLVVGGIVALAGGIDQLVLPDNWSSPFAGTSSDASVYALIMFKLYWSFAGWNNLNFSLGELKQPERNLPRAVLGGLTIVTVLFLLVNFAFISVLPAEVAFSNKEVVAAQFATAVFGPQFGRVVLPVFIAICAYGAVCAITFAISRVILTAARQRYLPASGFFGKLHRRFHTPLPALLLNWCLVCILMLSPPPGEAFGFLLDMVTYPLAMLFGTAVAGMLWLRRTEPDLRRPFRVWWPLSAIFVLVSLFIAVFPFVPPALPSTSDIPYYLSSLLGFLLLLVGVPFWYVMIPCRGSLRQAVCSPCSGSSILQESNEMQGVVVSEKRGNTSPTLSTTHQATDNTLA